jgi:hypothetical protein
MWSLDRQAVPLPWTGGLMAECVDQLENGFGLAMVARRQAVGA